MQTMPLLFPIAFGALFLAVLFWFYLVFKLFKHLRVQHPAKFEQMGRPGLFMNNNIRTNWALMRFLFKKEDEALRDNELSRIAAVMRRFFIAYGIAFSAFAIAILVTVRSAL